jgi:RNA polymerase sigma-70 factor (ECF subfamily)
MSDVSQRVAVVEQAFDRCGQAFSRYFAVRVGGDTHLVDDLMQQLWLRGRMRANELRGSSPEPWLWRIAQNLLREHWRRSGRQNGRLADPDLARFLARRFDEQELALDLLARQEVQDQLLLALTELPADEQALLIGFYFEGQTQRELATALGIGERAVEGRLYRARAALRDKLARLQA